MSMLRFLPVSLLFVFIISACQSDNQRELDTIESLLTDSPEEAFCLLNEIQVKNLKKRKDRARYALLSSAVMDKNYIDVASDSLTRIAVEYYMLRSDKYYRMLAWYYHGLVLMNAKSYSSSIVAFERAEKEAASLDDDYHYGLILRNKANVFNMTNNNPEAIACQQKAIVHFERAGKESHKSFAEVDLAIHYTNNKDYNIADSLFSTIRRNYDNPIIIRHCNLRRAGILVETERDPEEALSLYRKVPRAFYGFIDCAYLALAHERLNYKDSADYWMSEGYSRAKNQSDSATIDYMRSRLELIRGHYQQAFRLVDHASSIQDSLTRVLLCQSVSAAQRDYYKSETSLRDEKICSMRLKGIIGVAVVILVVSVLLMILHGVSQKKDRLLKEQMARLALKEREINSITKDNAHLIGSLFSEIIDHLDRLSESYFRTEDGKQKELLFRQIKELASKIRNDEGFYLSLEKDLDRYCKGVMSKLRVQVPRIKGNNLRIIMLFFAGFNYETVRFILNKASIESLKTIRSRFRKEIVASGAPDKDYFLMMLEMKKRSQAGTNENIEVC